MAIYSREINGSVTPATVSETERERRKLPEVRGDSDGWVPPIRERNEKGKRKGKGRGTRGKTG
jgi:hypothetical protein